MISSENKNWTTPILITTIVTIMLGMLYFSSSYLSKQATPQARKEFDYSGRPTQYMTTPNQVVLKINEKLAIGRNALVSCVHQPCPLPLHAGRNRLSCLPCRCIVPLDHRPATSAM